MEEEYYEEVPTESYEEELTGGDVLFIIGIGLVICFVVAFTFTLIKRTFKNVHLKIGDKIELGVETKDEK